MKKPWRLAVATALIPLLSLGATLWLMLNLKTGTWIKFFIWMVIGIAIYGLYGRWHSRLANEDSWDFDLGDTDPGTGGLQAIRQDHDRPTELRAIRTPPAPQQPAKPTRGKHMRN